MARTSRPYSSSYSSSITREGSLPLLRTGTNPAPSCCASAPPKMKPRDSTPTTTSTLPRPCRAARCSIRSEEHTSELQSRQYLVCRLLLEKKKKKKDKNKHKIHS